VRQLSTSLAGTSAFLQLTALTEYAGRPDLPTGGRDFMGPNDADRTYETLDGFVRVQLPPGSHVDSALLDSELSGRSTAESLSWCADHQIPAVAPRNAAEVSTDAYLHNQGLMQRRTTRKGVEFTLPGRYVSFSRTPQSPLPDAPGLGEHSSDVLGRAGISSDRISELSGRGVIALGGPLDLQFGPLYR